MRFGETPPSPGRPKPERFDPSKTIYGSIESGFSHEPRPGDLGRVRETPQPRAEQLIAAQASNLQASARSAREQLRISPEQRAVRIAAVGGLEQRLASAKAITERLESAAVSQQREADILSGGLEDLSHGRSPLPEFRQAVENLLAMTAQELQSVRQREQPSGAAAGYESPYVKQARERLQAFQNLLDRMDKLAA